MLNASPVSRLHKNLMPIKCLNSKQNSRALNGIALAMAISQPSAEKRRMKSFVIWSVLMIASSGFAASAAESSYSDYSNIDVVSVVPRSPSVKPYVMAIFTKQQLERVAAATPKKVATRAVDLRSSR
jgi:hypothetical protein